MNRTSFFRGLSIGLLVSFFLWSGIIFGISSLMQEDVNQLQMVDTVGCNDNVQSESEIFADADLFKKDDLKKED